MVVLVDSDTERTNGPDRRLGIGGSAEAGDPGLSVTERAEQHCPMRDRLVARHGDVPDETRERFDPHPSITGARTTP